MKGYNNQTGKEIIRFLSLFRYDIIYIKVRHKWFGRQLSLLENEIEETVWLSMSGLFSCVLSPPISRRLAKAGPI